jgi:hypothetical protein
VLASDQLSELCSSDLIFGMNFRFQIAQIVNLIAYVNLLIQIFVPLVAVSVTTLVISGVFWGALFIASFIAIILMGTKYVNDIAPENQKLSSDFSYIVKYIFTNFGLYCAILLAVLGIKHNLDTLKFAALASVVFLYPFYYFSQVSFITFDGKFMKVFNFSDEFFQFQIGQCISVKRVLGAYIFELKYRHGSGVEKVVYFNPKNNSLSKTPDPVRYLKDLMEKEKANPTSKKLQVGN